MIDHLDDEALCKLIGEAVAHGLQTGNTAYGGFKISDIFEEYQGRAEEVRQLLAIEREREACAKAAATCQVIIFMGDDGLPRVNGEGTRISAAEAIRARSNIGGN